MSNLKPLFKGLERVRRFRKTVARGSGFSLFFVVVIATLVAALALDVLTDMGKLERAATWLVLLGIVVAAFKRWVIPAWAFRESRLETAMLVEQQHDLPTDLVAAMQFTDDDRTQFGSASLREAAVHQAAELAPGLDYLEGFSRGQLKARFIMLVVSLVLGLGIGIVWPGHVRVFVNRFFQFGDAHYPTRTLIAEIVTPGDRAAFGLALPFEVRIDGKRPAEARIRLRSLSSRNGTEVTLRPDPNDPGRFTGLLTRALEDFSYQVFAGDAYTDPRRVTLTPLPSVEVDFEIETPAYAAAAFEAASVERSSRVVLAGSRVRPIVTADKQLRSATFTAFGQSRPMQAADDGYRLEPAGTPLALITNTMRWSVQVEDEEGFSLEQPVAGVLPVRPDRPPSIGIATSTRMVWDQAEPSIRYKAVDDYALAEITARISVQRYTDEGASQLDVSTRAVAVAKEHGVLLEGVFALSLNEFKLEKGDRMTVVFEARDYRGEQPGQSMPSEPVVLEVSDREGVLEALRDMDKEIEQKLDQIINAQLGIGGVL